MKGHVWEFIQTEPCDDGDGFWAIVEGPSGDEMIDNRWDTAAEAEAGGREFCIDANTPDRVWANEIANCAGMSGGIDAFNDAWGY